MEYGLKEIKESISLAETVVDAVKEGIRAKGFKEEEVKVQGLNLQDKGISFFLTVRIS